VNIGQHWSTVVNIGQQWSTVVNIGQQWSTVVNMGGKVKKKKEAIDGEKIIS
jgi:hypothetical protein